MCFAGFLWVCSFVVCVLWFCFVLLSSIELYSFFPSTLSMAKLHDKRHAYKPTDVTKKCQISIFEDKIRVGTT